MPSDPLPDKHLVLAVFWAEGVPDDLTKAAADAVRPLKVGRGVAVSFAESVTREPGFDDTLSRLDVGEVLPKTERRNDDC